MIKKWLAFMLLCTCSMTMLSATVEAKYDMFGNRIKPTKKVTRQKADESSYKDPSVMEDIDTLLQEYDADTVLTMVDENGTQEDKDRVYDLIGQQEYNPYGDNEEED